jgi:hypothetical protein
MKQNKRLLAAWQNGARLGLAWLGFADERNKERFGELQARGDGSHLGRQNWMEIDLIARLYAGELQAIGIEYGSDAGPTLIPQYYFSRAAKVDWERETVAELGKKFEQVRVQPIDEALSEAELVDPRLVQEEQGPLDQAIGEPDPVGREPESASQVQASAREPGRPSNGPEIERAIDILLERGVDLANIPRRKAYKAVRACAAKELDSNTKLGFSDPVIQRSLFKRFGRRR